MAPIIFWFILGERREAAMAGTQLALALGGGGGGGGRQLDLIVASSICFS